MGHNEMLKHQREKEDGLKECAEDLNQAGRDFYRAWEHLCSDLSRGDITLEDYERDLANLKNQSKACWGVW